MQIVEYSRFIIDDLSVRRAWVEGDFSRTSVTGVDELYEQIFDDLDSDALERELGTHFADDASKGLALTAFLEKLRAVDTARSNDKRLMSPTVLLRSTEWSELVQAARIVALKFQRGASGRELSKQSGSDDTDG